MAFMIRKSTRFISTIYSSLWKSLWMYGLGQIILRPSWSFTGEGNLSITGLQYCAMELPDQRYPYGEAYPLIIDLAEPTEFVLQAASFACRLWVNQWNGFIHLAAQAAELMWTGQPINRKHA